MGKVLLVGVLIVALLSGSTLVHGLLHEEEEGYMDVIRHKLSNLWPFGEKLGYDWEDTQLKVESIYRNTHQTAKDRVEQLKEDTIADAEIQKKIADIYQEEAERAEKEIEALKRPLMDKLTSWMRFYGREPNPEEKRTLLEKLGWSSHKSEELLPRHLYEDTTKKISETYRSALEGAKRAMSDASDKAGEAGSAATRGWKATKAKAEKAYSQAFQHGHSETRRKFDQFREMMGRGVRGLGSGTISAARKTVELIWSLLSSVVLLALGGVGTLWAMRLWNKQQMHNQMRANVLGPVVACGEYYVVGGEAEQKKFHDFWSGTGYGYFSRQPGLKKYWVHRGVPGGENNWMSYSEWASIDDLRRACSTTEFAEIKKRSPGYPAKQMHIYQLASSGGQRAEGEVLTGKDTTTTSSTTTTTTGGLRQRTF